MSTPTTTNPTQIKVELAASFAENIKAKNYRLRQKNVDFLDAQAFQQSILDDLETLGSLQVLNVKDGTIYPLSFRCNGTIVLDPSYALTRKVHDVSASIFTWLTGWKSEFDNERENLLYWAKFVKNFYENVRIEKVEALKAAKVGLEVLDKYYMKKNCADPKAHILPKVIDILGNIEKTDAERVLNMADFPAELAKLLRFTKGDPTADIRFLSFRLEILSREWSLDKHYQFLTELCSDAGWSAEDLALFLACLFWEEQDNYLKNPKVFLKDLRSEMKKGGQNPKLMELYQKVEARMLKILSSLLDHQKELDAASRDRREENAQKIYDRLKPLVTLVQMPKNGITFVADTVDGLVKIKKSIRELRS